MLICVSISIYDAFLLNLSFRFVDRDMFMRFRGGGVGHKSIQKKIHKFCNDRWPEERNDTPPHSPVQPTDENEETAAQPEGSALINPNAEDVELPEEEAESNSEDGDDDSDEEGSEDEADEADSDDLEYADY
jgi:hypothetical protein